MTDEPKKNRPEDIESILSDLDAILSEGGGIPAAAQPETSETPVPVVPPKPSVPVEPPKPSVPVEPPKPSVPVELPKPPAPVELAKPPAPVMPPKPPAPVELPKPPAPVAPPNVNQVELAPREGFIAPPEKKSEPPKPAPKPAGMPPSMNLSAPAAPVAAKAPEPVKPAAPPPLAPTAAPPPAAVVASTKIEELPVGAPKEQIRRVAYIYTSSCSEVRTACSAFLSQAARTISKKPLFLREVLSHEVGAASDLNAVLQKALQVKAVAILAIVDDWPRAKTDELSEICARANMMFRAVAAEDAQKKSTAVDIIVDMMLLPGEG